MPLTRQDMPANTSMAVKRTWDSVDLTGEEQTTELYKIPRLVDSALFFQGLTGRHRGDRDLPAQEEK